MGSHKLPKVKTEIEKEVWVPIKGYEMYEVSNLSRIRTVKMKKYINPHYNISGYPTFAIGRYNNETKIRLYWHRIVAIAFIPNPENKPQVNHKNGIKSDFSLSNLEWMTASENRKHAFDTGLSDVPRLKGSKNAMSKLKEADVIDILKMGLICEIAGNKICKIYDLEKSVIHLILNGKLWKTQYEEFKKVFLI